MSQQKIRLADMRSAAPFIRDGARLLLSTLEKSDQGPETASEMGEPTESNAATTAQRLMSPAGITSGTAQYTVFLFELPPSTPDSSPQELKHKLQEHLRQAAELAETVMAQPSAISQEQFDMLLAYVPVLEKVLTSTAKVAAGSDKLWLHDAALEPLMQIYNLLEGPKSATGYMCARALWQSYKRQNKTDRANFLAEWSESLLPAPAPAEGVVAEKPRPN